MSIESLKKEQPTIVQMINNSYERNKLAHAYIYEGEEGAGMSDAAIYFALKLLCESDNKPCLSCNTCKRILNNSHTNVNIIEPIQNMIRKDQIEMILHESKLTSLEDGARIYIINEAHKLNPASSNALLKFLEEPFPNHYIILTTSNKNLLLSTIISRSQVIHFKPKNRNNLYDKLVEKGIEADTAFILSNVTISEEDTVRLINEGSIINIIDLVKKINNAKNMGNDPYIAFILNKDVLYKESEYNLHELFFQINILFLEEKIKYLKISKNVHFKDIITKSNFEVDTIEKLIEQLDIMNEYENRIKSYVNMELLYASMFLKI